jgi:hypothetical protein
MEQRSLRLGDILDDYCPRERRVTNHAVVAMVEQDVKQTRCTTCDTEHVYKGGKAPRRKKPETTGALYKEVLAGITDQDASPGSALAAGGEADHDLAAAGEPAPADQPVAIAADAHDGTEPDEPQPVIDEGPVHRPLIRAQLARPEGIKIERQAPEFTIRQNPSGRGGFRGGGGSNNGHRFGRGPRPGGSGGGGGRGPNQGFGRGPGGQQRSGRPPKRSR